MKFDKQTVVLLPLVANLAGFCLVLYHNIVLIVTYSDYNVAITEDEIVDTLKRFWEVEAIGIADVSVDQQPDSKFLDHITFTGERYEVNLPWKEGNLNFSVDYILSLNRLRSLHRRL